MNIVNIDTEIIIDPKHERVLKSLGNLQTYKDIPSIDMQRNRVREADIIIAYNLPTELMITASHLKMICISATGYDRVDIAVAKKRNIVVSNCPGFSTEAVAEHTIGLLLATLRHIPLATSDLKLNKPQTTLYKGFELKGKSLGIIGYGSIGRRVAQIAKDGFGMNILHINSSSSLGNLNSLLKNSDIISIHAPLTDKTRGLIGAKEFKLMKDNVVIINTARGAILDEQAFVSALKNGKVYGSGLDVLIKEPMDITHPLFSFPNVIITHHMGWYTNESEHNLSALITKNIQSFIKGKPINIVS